MSLFSFDELKFKLHSIQNPAIALITYMVKVNQKARAVSSPPGDEIEIEIDEDQKKPLTQGNRRRSRERMSEFEDFIEDAGRRYGQKLAKWRSNSEPPM